MKTRGERALILFVTAGDPSLEELPGIIGALAEGGADVVEVGIPFSDPIADGPTIQASSQRALDRGVTPPGILQTLGAVKADVPLVAMGYLNPMLRLGLGKSAQELKAAGVSGVIVSDLIPEEAGPWQEAARPEGLATIFLAAPTSTDARLVRVAEASSGFVYAVSRTGVTGDARGPEEALLLVDRLRSLTDLPICVGFGVSEPQHVRSVAEFADGVVIGSALVTLLAEKWHGGAGREQIVAQVQAWKAATLG
ncbi:MAG: tryptophan synthase subunit alpha [Fimbriimonas ginsengisoli]|uniref:Tryptophan synthase alpha chain n=1 Tax=Fimbriimonas ginsengisoli TaxID=1005039 RepID=A0A931LQX7_FIMGI|nr:tryptophan synthase subunit alpha [Fimbriimonas ginsengisoli]MBI3721713.1 tryptophan synthase subunit alpha [Fimbriimonas ginsengisoli]